MLLCKKCFNSLKICECKGNNISTFECDELMVNIIKILNLKGYKTEYCCSGHLFHTIYDSNKINGYILFSKLYKFKNLPKGIIQEDETEPYTIGACKRTCLRFRNIKKFDKHDYEKQITFIMNSIKKLNKWVKTL